MFLLDLNFILPIDNSCRATNRSQIFFALFFFIFMPTKTFLNILKISCLLLVLLLSWACGGGGGSVKKVSDIPELSVSLKGSLETTLLKSGLRGIPITGIRTFELLTLSGKVLETLQLEGSQYQFKAAKGQAYLVRSTFNGYTFEAITEILDSDQVQNLSLNSTIAAVMAKKLYPDLSNLSKLNTRRALINNAVIAKTPIAGGVDWVQLIANQVTSKNAIDEIFWMNSGIISTTVSELLAHFEENLGGNGQTQGLFALSGKVLDSNGLPLVGVSVKLKDAALAIAETDGAGIFRTSGLSAGLNQLSFVKNGYSEGVQQVWLGKDGAIDDGKTILLSGSGTIDAKGVELIKGQLNIQLKASQSVGLSDSAVITIGKPGQSMSMRYAAKGGQAYAVIRMVKKSI
jgi:hypothetical protein